MKTQEELLLLRIKLENEIMKEQIKLTQLRMNLD